MNCTIFISLYNYTPCNSTRTCLLADVLRHESGLAWLDHTFKIDDFMVENLKKNKVGEIFEKEPPHFPGTGGANDVPTNREYHTITRGCVLNEIVRRVDPQNRTIGEIIKQVSAYNLHSSNGFVRWIYEFTVTTNL